MAKYILSAQLYLFDYLSCIANTIMKTQNASIPRRNSLCLLQSTPPSPDKHWATVCPYSPACFQIPLNGFVDDKDILRLASFTCHILLRITPCYCVYQWIVPFRCWMRFHCMDIPQFVIHSPAKGHMGDFQSGTFRNKAAIRLRVSNSSGKEVWTGAILCRPGKVLTPLGPT